MSIALDVLGSLFVLAAVGSGVLLASPKMWEVSGSFNGYVIDLTLALGVAVVTLAWFELPLGQAVFVTYTVSACMVICANLVMFREGEPMPDPISVAAGVVLAPLFVVLILSGRVARLLAGRRVRG